MFRICMDYGHGGASTGAVYKSRYEKDDVLRLGLAISKRLRDHGILVDETRTQDRDVSLKERSKMENQKTYDYFVSLHRNAYKPEEANGVETYTYISQRPEARGLAGKIQGELVALGFRDRGIKKANFHVLAATRAPAVLVEVGFIDNSKDNNIFDTRFKDIVEGIGRAILDQLGVKYKLLETKPQAQVLYRVMAGSYAIRENAEKQLEKLKKAGFEAIIVKGTS